MEYIKTYEGFFDFFGRKKEISEDDKIINDYIKRLKRIKGVSPYDITLDTHGTEEGEKYHYRYKVWFEDTPIHIRAASCASKYKLGWSEETQKGWIEDGAIKKNNHLFYSMSVEVMGEEVYIKTSASKIEELFNLVQNVYKIDKEARRIQKIRTEMNPAADKLDPDIYPENNK
jgi:hypothetical protein